MVGSSFKCSTGAGGGTCSCTGDCLGGDGSLLEGPNILANDMGLLVLSGF